MFLLDDKAALGKHSPSSLTALGLVFAGAGILLERVCLVFDSPVLLHASEWKVKALKKKVLFFSASTLLLHHVTLSD